MSEATYTSVAIYAGPLSIHQGREISVRQQVDRCWNYSNQRGWRVATIFVDQRKTESLVKRANFRNMLKEARKGIFAIIVFCSLEYLCGSQADLLVAERSIRKSRVAFRNAMRIGGHMLGGFYKQRRD